MVSSEVLSDALARMGSNLTTADARGRRTILGRFVDRVEADKERARLWYGFPLLAQRGLYVMPPGEYLFGIKCVPAFPSNMVQFLCRVERLSLGKDMPQDWAVPTITQM